MSVVNIESTLPEIPTLESAHKNTYDSNNNLLMGLNNVYKYRARNDDERYSLLLKMAALYKIYFSIKLLDVGEAFVGTKSDKIEPFKDLMTELFQYLTEKNIVDLVKEVDSIHKHKKIVELYPYLEEKHIDYLILYAVINNSENIYNYLNETFEEWVTDTST